MKGLISVVAYNRIDEVKRLLTCIQKISYSGNYEIDLVLSVDFSSRQFEFEPILDEVIWPFGKKEFIKRSENYGLKQHVLACMSLTSNYEFNIVLEEDLIISPFFMGYVEECLKNENDMIGMFSLYSYTKNEDDKTDFYPMIDSYDNYFIQYASSWGFLITNKQWHSFEGFLQVNDCDFFYDESVPSYVSAWSKSSWKKHFIRFLIHTDKYTCFPRFSLTSNPGVDGKHHKGIGGLYSVPVLLGARVWRLSLISDSNALYDSHFNLKTNGFIMQEINYLNDSSNSLGSISRLTKSSLIQSKYYLMPNEVIKIFFKSLRFLIFKIINKIK